AAAPDRDSVLLVVIDTLRADIADAGMNGEPPAMPELARIAASGTRFTQAVSPAPWTLPATVSALSGWNPHRHRFGASASDWEVLRGDPKALYLAGALRDTGYLTAAYVNNPYLRPYFGFGEGFYTMRPYHGRAVDGVALALDWLGERAGTPAFTLLHLMDPHWPFDAPPGFGEEPGPCATCDSLVYSVYTPVSDADRAELKRRYTAEVRYTDAMFGRFYDALASSGSLDRTWVIITADHGEEFWEHGHFLHGHSLHDELLRVPLVIIPPRTRDGAERGRRVDVQVRLEDVAATVLEISGLDPSLAPDGRSLVSLATGAADAEERVAVAGYLKSIDDLSWAVRRPPWKAVVSTEMSRNRLYRLEDDPGELRSLLFNPSIPDSERAGLSAQFFALVRTGRAQGYSVARSVVAGAGAAPEADTAGRLRSLGYAQ
ncbi:MAG: sulfatase, partial [Candidatus Binatia bacterium]